MVFYLVWFKPYRHHTHINSRVQHHCDLSSAWPFRWQECHQRPRSSMLTRQRSQTEPCHKLALQVRAAVVLWCVAIKMSQSPLDFSGQVWWWRREYMQGEIEYQMVGYSWKEWWASRCSCGNEKERNHLWITQVWCPLGHQRICVGSASHQQKHAPFSAGSMRCYRRCCKPYWGQIYIALGIASILYKPCSCKGSPAEE